MPSGGLLAALHLQTVNCPGLLATTGFQNFRGQGNFLNKVHKDWPSSHCSGVFFKVQDIYAKGKCRLFVVLKVHVCCVYFLGWCVCVSIIIVVLLFCILPVPSSGVAKYQAEIWLGNEV